MITKQVPTAVEKSQGSLGFLTYAAIVSALGGFLFGYDTVVINGAVSQVSRQFSLSSAMVGTFVASALFGCMIGSAMAGFLSDNIGRKKTLTFAALLIVVSALGCGIAWSAWSLIIFRWIGGVGVGFASMVCPLYISEISPSHLRGRLVTLFQFAITVGIFVSFLANTGWQSLSSAGGSETGLYHLMVVSEVWRAMFASVALPAAVFFFMCFSIPETPRFLAKIGKDAKAMEILVRIGGRAIAEQQMAEIRDVLAIEEGRMGELIRPGFRKALFVALFLAIVSEMSGVTVVLYYGSKILSSAGVPFASALGGFALVGLVNMVFTMLAIWLMDKAGRRPLLGVGTLGCCIALASLGVLFMTGNSGGFVIMALICLFMACFAFSIGPVKWVVMSEIFPTRIRGRAVAIATLAVWATDWIYNQMYPVLTDNFLFKLVGNNMGTGIVFLFFAVVLIPQLYFAWKIMPETKNRSLEEIEREWMEA
ncbi:MAG: sugar porter family MFS transporter [Armatimonadota bacterium]